MDNVKPYEHDEDIKVWKVALKLNDGRVVSFKTVFTPSIGLYEYFDGPNIPTNHVGLHSYEHRETAVDMAMLLSAVSHKISNYEDVGVKSVIVMTATIPKESDTKTGYCLGKAESNLGYISNELVVDLTPIFEAEVEENRETFKRILNERLDKRTF